MKAVNSSRENGRGRERTSAIKQRAVKIFFEADLAAVKGRKREVVPVLEFFPVQMKGVRSLLPRSTVPTVGQDDAADVPKEGGDLGQAAYLRFLLDAATKGLVRQSLKKRASAAGTEILPVQLGFYSNLQ